MTTSARQAEADRVELVYYWALGQLGNAMIVDSRDLWLDVPATPQAARAGWWLAAAIELLGGFRAEAHALAIAYYRLVRALRTGATAAHGNEQAGDQVSLEALRDDFEKVVDEIELETRDEVAELGDSPAFDTEEPELELGDDEDAIEVEDIGNIDELIDAANEAALEEAAIDLDALGLANMLSKIEKIDGDSDTRDEDLLAAHLAAGDRQAAAAARITMNAARGLVYDLADTDFRVMGWVRYSKTGKPCGFCAMLISRGIVYKTATAAAAKSREDGTRSVDLETGQAASEQDKYHDLCKCVAVPIFLQEQYDNNPMFDQGRELTRLWNLHIKRKFSGDLALSKWRHYLRHGFPDEPSLAQAA